jgi:RHS repeat-associated protein
LGDSYEGTLKNGYLYNGKELFEDGDLNWYDYGFRNYDPQIGRFTQLDPLTDSYPFLTPYQYASCDPITNIDVDGLEGCPATSAMTGYVGNVGRAAGGESSIGNIFNGIAAVARIAGPAASIANLGVNVINTTSQQSIVKQQLATNTINGGFTTGEVGSKEHGPNAGGGQKGTMEDAEADCNCPPGYSTKPKPGGDQAPYFLYEDAAAIYWAYKVVGNDLHTGRAEYSSEIRSINVKNGNSMVALFRTTDPVRFPSKSEAYKSSPGIGNILHGPLLSGQSRAGVIHFHWQGSEDESIGTRSDNKTFSEQDKINNSLNPEKYMYVLGSAGTLWAQYPQKLKRLPSGFPDPDEGKELIIGRGFYEKDKGSPTLCGCYKQ